MDLPIQSLTMFQRVAAVVASHLSVDQATLAETSTFEEMGADSLDLVEVVMQIEDHFNIEIPDEVAEDWKTLGDVVAHVDAALKT